MSDIEQATQEADDEIDTSGLVCPEPLMLVRNRVRGMSPGEVLYVIATDPSTQRDFTNFCRFMQHELLASWYAEDRHRYLIRKGGSR